MTFAEVQVKWSVILIDRLGPDIFSTLRMKGHVLHRARAHLKVPGWSAKQGDDLATDSENTFILCSKASGSKYLSMRLRDHRSDLYVQYIEYDEPSSTLIRVDGEQ